MSNELKNNLNTFLVDIFHAILKIQEDSLKNGNFSDLSLNKMHIVEEICKNKHQNMSSIAESLDITMGTLTVAVENLVKKGYLKKVKSPQDKRVISVVPTDKGILANAEHEAFHRQMVQGVSDRLNDEELSVLVKAVVALSEHFSELKNNQNRGN